MEISKNTLRSLIREMIRQEKGLIKEGVTKVYKSGSKIVVSNPENLKKIIVKGMDAERTAWSVDPSKSQKFNYAKGLIGLTIQNTSTQQLSPDKKSKLQSLGVTVIDNTDTNGTVIIMPTKTTSIQSVRNIYGDISQKVIIKSMVGIKLIESKKRGNILKEEVINGKARIPAQGVNLVILKGFADYFTSKLKPKTSAQAQDSKQNPVIQASLNGTAEYSQEGSTLVIQAAGEGVTINLVTPAYQDVRIQFDSSSKITRKTKTIGTRGGFNRGEFDYN